MTNDKLGETFSKVIHETSELYIAALNGVKTKKNHVRVVNLQNQNSVKYTKTLKN